MHAHSAWHQNRQRVKVIFAMQGDNVATQVDQGWKACTSLFIYACPLAKRTSTTLTKKLNTLLKLERMKCPWLHHALLHFAHALAIGRSPNLKLAILSGDWFTKFNVHQIFLLYGMVLMFIPAWVEECYFQLVWSRNVRCGQVVGLGSTNLVITQ